MIADDDRPARKTTHEIGCDLSLLAADELRSRIALLKAEIERLEAECIRKQAGRLAAENLFKT
ncbi:DUF1192 domain-containing protein [Ciceribacter sp. L1K23]|uniref:DUF1192 domain-containing protein n=1 Tax=Ciceribacter sp. L1K23 TaxID=2820276 RepID=UPI001B82A17C|nr:DUF1192 domain-containing protein [Ciceribacter sp. L1K23]MBR0558204.1 DUF1192 domain-containing protein [Ciceribacter sp. L1K23]